MGSSTKASRRRGGRTSFHTFQKFVSQDLQFFEYPAVASTDVRAGLRDKRRLVRSSLLIWRGNLLFVGFSRSLPGTTAEKKENWNCVRLRPAGRSAGLRLYSMTAESMYGS